MRLWGYVSLIVCCVTTASTLKIFAFAFCIGCVFMWSCCAVTILLIRGCLQWRMGYCNAFAWDKERRAESRSGAGSVGLGGNISQSFGEFMQKKLPYTTAGNLMTCGNGSIMRNFALPIFYQANPEHVCPVLYVKFCGPNSCYSSS